MNIDFELYKIFYTVARYSNITKASKILHISQPAISKSIKKLEDQLCGQLFIRTKKGVVLTEEGKEFYSYIEQAIEFITSAENKFSDLINLNTGCIKIGINSTLAKHFLMPYLNFFHTNYPNIDIKIISGLTKDLISKLKNGLVDLVILNTHNKIYTNDIKLIECQTIADCFIANKNYSKLLSNDISLKELTNYPLILQAPNSNSRCFLEDLGNKYKVSFSPTMEIASHSIIVELVKAGFGIGFTTKEFIKKELDNHEVFEIKLKEKIPNRSISIAISNNHLPNFSVKKFIEIVTNKKGS